MEINDLYILNLFLTQNGCLNKNYTRDSWLLKHKDILDFLLNRYSDSKSIQETIYRIKNNLEIRPICKTCGKSVNFKCFSRGFAEYCSHKCQMNNEESINKIKQTKFKKYGNASYVNSKKARQTNLERYGEVSYTKTKECKEKSKQTCMEKYGVEYSGQSENNKQKSKQTCMEKYGVEYSFQSKNNKEKSKQTWIKKYGVDNPAKSEIIKDKIKQVCISRYGENYMKNPIIFNKIKNTCFRKYGNYYLLTDEFKQKYINTIIKNNRISKVENGFMNYLEYHYPNDFEYQYKSELYPFNCDFYIKSLDLYIEIQGTWTHGGHPFDENNQDDIDRLNYMKSKNSNYYNSAIQVWTIVDVTKRNIAKENNLNYLEIFTKNPNEAIKIFEDLIETGTETLETEN